MSATARVNLNDPGRAISCPVGDNAIDLGALALVRQAIDEAREQHKAVAFAIGVDAAYLTRMLAGEKPFPIQKLDRLPESVRHIYARLEAEREGWQVVEETNRRRLIRRVIGELLVELASDVDPRLPLRAGLPLKAGLH